MGSRPSKARTVPINYTKEEYIYSLLNDLHVDPNHGWKTVGNWAINSLQDAQYGSVSEREVKLIRALMTAIRDTPYGNYDIKYFYNRHSIRHMQASAEANMIKVLNENPELKEWFMNYEVPTYMFVDHPNVLKLEKLVDSDGHSGASFSLCCRSVKQKLLS